MWWLAYTLVGFFFVACVAFVTEVVLALRQQNFAASRPSTWLTLFANAVRRLFWNIGWLYGVWPDVARWMRRAWQLICDLFFPVWLREVAEKAGTDLLTAFRALIKAPLGYFDGLWDGLRSISIIGWVLVFLTTLATGVVIESVAINYDLPAPFWPTWYLGFVGDAAYAIYEAFPKAWEIICRIPDGLFALAEYIKHLVPEKVYSGWLAEAGRLSYPYRYLAARWGITVFRAVLLVSGLALAALAIYRMYPSNASHGPHHSPGRRGFVAIAEEEAAGDEGDDGDDDDQAPAVATKRKRVARKLVFEQLSQ